MKMKTISVDLDIHKKIEAMRQEFAETENDILRRHFGFREHSSSVHPDSSHPKGSLPPAWSRKGVELPEGTELFLTYPGVSAWGKIQDGVWAVGEEIFHSPSSAACTIVTKSRGRKVSVNGWDYWKVKRPTDSDWVLLNSLRNKIDRRPRH